MATYVFTLILIKISWAVSVIWNSTCFLMSSKFNCLVKQSSWFNLTVEIGGHFLQCSYYIIFDEFILRPLQFEIIKQGPTIQLSAQGMYNSKLHISLKRACGTKCKNWITINERTFAKYNFFFFFFFFLDEKLELVVGKQKQWCHYNHSQQHPFHYFEKIKQANLK